MESTNGVGLKKESSSRYLLFELQSMIRSAFQTRFESCWREETGKGWVRGQSGDEFREKDRKFFKSLQFESYRQKILNEDVREWDVCLFANIFRRFSWSSNVQRSGLPSRTSVQALADARNRFSHSGETLRKDDVDSLWEKISQILTSEFAVPASELEDLRCRIESEREFLDQRVPSTDDKEAQRWKEEGNKSFKKKNYEEAVDYYEQAVYLGAVSQDVLGILYTNLCFANTKIVRSRGASAEGHLIETAVYWGKRAVECVPRWWKAHERLGEAQELARNFVEAQQCLMRALSFARVGREGERVKEDLERRLQTVRQELGQHARREELNSQFLTGAQYHEQIEELKIREGTTDPVPDERAVALMCNSNSRERRAQGFVIRGHFLRDKHQDMVEAKKCYSKAAELGNAEGMYNLAVLISQRSRQPDYRTALSLLRRAAECPERSEIGMDGYTVGVREAWHALGNCYLEGTGVVKNEIIAVEWFRRAAEAGDMGSLNSLGVLYGRGEGVECDPVHGLALIRAAAERGNAEACMNLAKEYLHGRGTTIDVPKAEMWARAAQRLGCMSAVSLLDVISKQGQQQEMGPNEALRMMKSVPVLRPVADLLSSLQKYGQVTPRSISEIGKQRRSFESLKSAAQGSSGYASFMFKTHMKFWQSFRLVERPRELYAHVAAVYRRPDAEVVVPEVIHSLIEVLSQQYPLRPHSVDESIVEYHCLWKGTDVSERVAQLNSLVERFPDEPVFLISLAQMLSFPSPMEDYRRAVQLFAAVRKKNDVSQESLVDLQYLQATVLRLLAGDVGQSRTENAVSEDSSELYKSFLKEAFPDHRKRPNAFFGLAQNCIGQSGANPNRVSEGTVAEIRCLFEKGVDAERNVSDLFVERSNANKDAINLFLESVAILKATPKTGSLESSEGKIQDHTKVELCLDSLQSPLSEWRSVTSDWSRMLRLRRLREIRSSRRAVERGENPRPTVLAEGKKPIVVNDWALLKPIGVEEMIAAGKDEIYEGRVAEVLIISACSRMVAHEVVVLDSDDCVIPVAFYGISVKKARTKLAFGRRLQIGNPYFRLSYNRRNRLRVDDVRGTVKFGEVVRLCWTCLQCKTDLRGCSKCNKPQYCSQECEERDWRWFGHSLDCRIA